MIAFPPCKINLGLRITARRPDGYHDLETLFLPVPLTDILEIVRADALGLSLSGIPLPPEPVENNLCVKAWQLLKADYPALPAVQIHLYKHIPIGGGLGGGSADGAWMLQLLNRKFELACTPEQLAAYALKLGSDCPFFLHTKPCLAYGRGEILEETDLSHLNGYRAVLINPGIHISTAWAFGQISPGRPATSVREIITEPVAQWRGRLVNDFEQPVVAQYPEIAALLEAFYASGAEYAALSGSGSTVFGLYAPDAAAPPLPAASSQFRFDWVIGESGAGVNT